MPVLHQRRQKRDCSFDWNLGCVLSLALYLYVFCVRPSFLSFRERVTSSLLYKQTALAFFTLPIVDFRNYKPGLNLKKENEKSV